MDQAQGITFSWEQVANELATKLAKREMELAVANAAIKSLQSQVMELSTLLPEPEEADAKYLGVSI